MNLKKLSKISDASTINDSKEGPSWTVSWKDDEGSHVEEFGDEGSAEDFADNILSRGGAVARSCKVLGPESSQKFIRDGKSGDDMYQLVRKVVSKDLIKRASQGILSWNGADRPGENIVVGPASKAWEIFNDVHEVDEEYLSDSGLDEKVAEFLGEELDNDYDAEKYIATLKKNPQLLAERGDPSQKYFLVIEDWNDLGEDVVVGFCDEGELVELLVGSDDDSDGSYECPFGLYHTMVDAGLDPTKFKYLNTNDDDPVLLSYKEVPELPTYEKVPQDLSYKIWVEGLERYFSWD